ncbi:MAG: type II toxin-antitoxin system RelE/ParE family toxin, partial [Imperialibacter sp.]
FELQEYPQYGVDLGHGLFKIRLSISSKGKGKSGGARVITYVKIVQETVFLVSLYDKGELESVSKEQILELLKKTGLA